MNISRLTNNNVHDHKIKVYSGESELEILIKLSLSFGLKSKIIN